MEGEEETGKRKYANQVKQNKNVWAQSQETSVQLCFTLLSISVPIALLNWRWQAASQFDAIALWTVRNTFMPIWAQVACYRISSTLWKYLLLPFSPFPSLKEERYFRQYDFFEHILLPWSNGEQVHDSMTTLPTSKVQYVSKYVKFHGWSFYKGGSEIPPSGMSPLCGFQILPVWGEATAWGN